MCIAGNTDYSAMSDVDVLSAKEIEGAKEWVNKLFDQGHMICFFTQRPKKVRGATLLWLKRHHFSFHYLIMGKPDAAAFHYVDDRHVQATTFKGRYTPLIKRDHSIQVFG